MKYTNNQYCIIHEIGEKACIYIKTFGIMVYVPDVIWVLSTILLNMFLKM